MNAADDTDQRALSTARTVRRLLLAAAAVLLAGCAGLTSAGGRDDRTVLVDYDHDEVASTFAAYYPSNVTVHPGDEVVFRQQWTGEGHSVTLGTIVDESFKIARPLMAKYVDEEPPEEVLAPFMEVFGQLPYMVDDNLNVNQNGAQPCFLEEGAPPQNPNMPCTDAQQRQPAFNGRQSFYNSGFIPYEGPRGNEFRVPISADIAPGTYTYYCNLHDIFMNGTIEVVPENQPIPSQAEVSRQAYEEIQATAAPLLAAYRDALAAEDQTEIVGLTVSKPFAGWFPETEAVPAWINEFVPRRTEVQAGQSLTWSFVGGHTVSFDVPPYFSEFVVRPDGTVEWTRDAVAPRGRRLITDAPEPAESASARPEVQSSEAHSEGSEAPGGPPAVEELQVDAGRWDGEGFLSSGAQFGGTYTVTFTRPGVYPYACLIHPRMVGEVVVR